tara:strand:+ start:495 stop:797 length:303 start_codon:yes stop_codon:yes gene_type:complete
MVKDKKSINRNKIAKNINIKFGLPISYANRILIDTIEIIKNGLIKNKYLKIKNFGTFKIIRKKSRIGRNPKTKEIFEINERNVISFKASHNIKDKLNKNV